MRWDVRAQMDVVLDQPCGLWVEAGHDRATGGSTYRLRHVRVFEYKAGIGEAVEMGRFDPFVAVAAHGVSALLVGENEENVRRLIGHRGVLAIDPLLAAR